VFGWLAYSSLLNPYGRIAFFGFIPLPMFLSPFASLIFTQLIVWRASFIVRFYGIDLSSQG
jgi:uncharacterized membrane protein